MSNKSIEKTHSHQQEPYIINDFGTYQQSPDDWLVNGEKNCPNHPVAHTFYYYYHSLLLSKIAGFSDYTDDE